MLKARTGVTIVVGAYMLGLLGYGLIKYPDAPLQFCASSGYCGKGGQPHSQKEFEQFLVWQSLLEWTWIPGVLTIFFLNRSRIRRLKRPPNS